MLKKYYLLFKKSSFAKNASGLMFASIVARSIGIISVMVLSRLFSQDEIGVYFVFVSYAVIFSTISTLCYHQAFPNASNEEDIVSLFKLILLLALISLCVLLIICELLNYKYSVLLPIYIVGLSLLSAFEYYFVRISEFLPIVILRVVPPLLFLVALLYIWLFADSTLSILVASQVVTVVVVVFFTYVYIFSKKLSLSLACPHNILHTMKEFKHFATYLMPSQLFAVGAIHVPTIIIERYIGAFAAAQWGMVVRVCFGSIGILSESIAKSYHAKFSQMVREKRGDIDVQFNKLSRVLVMLGFVVFFGMFVIIPYLMPVLFAGDWSMASHMTMVLAPMFGIMMLVMPLSVIFLVLGYQRYVFWNQLSMFVLSLVAFVAGAYWGDIIAAVILLSILNTIRYIFIYLAERKAISLLMKSSE